MAQLLFAPDELILEYPVIYGLSTHLWHTRLGYLFNSHPDFSLEFYPDISSFSKKSIHSAYQLTFLDDNSSCLLIKNKGTQDFFYKKYKSIDYLACSLSDEEINPKIISIIGKLNDISICFALNNPDQTEILNFTQLL